MKDVNNRRNWGGRWGEGMWELGVQFFCKSKAALKK